MLINTYMKQKRPLQVSYISLLSIPSPSTYFYCLLGGVKLQLQHIYPEAKIGRDNISDSFVMHGGKGEGEFPWAATGCGSPNKSNVLFAKDS